MTAAHALLDGLIDYAGLFPPASLDMPSAVRAYAEYREGDDSELLGRFIVPASRLSEFAETVRQFVPGAEQWRVSAIGGDDALLTLQTVQTFNDHLSTDGSTGAAVCDAIEMSARSAEAVSIALETFPECLNLFFEFPVEPDPTPLIAKLSGTRAFAKIRTGGVVESAIPTSAQILRFIRACSEHRVPFKATAGLHHALRGDYPLTYAPDAPHGIMYGYLNIFLAAAFLEAGMDDANVISLLDETDAAALRIDDAGIRWRNFSVSTSQLSRTRRLLATSFGSCSFVEPVAEAKALNII
jgi:hypothetical protein